MKKVLLMAAMAVLFIACRDSNSSAREAVDVAMKCLVNNDFKGYAQFTYIEETQEERVQEIILSEAANSAEKMYKENPVIDYEILNEEVQGEDKAVVDVKIIQKDGKETISKMNMVKNQSGEWKIKANKDGNESVTAEEKKSEDTVETEKDDSIHTYSVKGVEFKMIDVEGGTFSMGATPEQDYCIDAHELPVHDVTLSDFCIGETEVTQLLWMAVMGSLPKYMKSKSHFIGYDLPVVYVSWDECQTFISKLNDMTEGQRPNGREFRMPTEAEWEFAARGGNKSNHTQYAGSSILTSVAWCNKNSRLRPNPVATKLPNELGLYDMTGNVHEWCQDWYAPDYYRRSPSINPCNNNPTSYKERVFRGGCFFSEGESRVAFRNKREPEYGRDNIGFRLAL